MDKVLLWHLKLLIIEYSYSFFYLVEGRMFTKCKDVMDKVFALFGWADIYSAGNKDASISSRLTIPIVGERKQFLLFHLSFIGLICSLLPRPNS
jgi:hypothetical protein